MIITPYQSTTCKDYDLKRVVADVMEERINGKLIPQGRIELVGPESTIPVFTQPLTRLEFGDRRDAPNLVVDARAMVKLTRNSDQPWVVSNYNEFDLMRVRSRFQLLWQSEDYARQNLLRVGDLPAIVWVNWISKTLSYRLSLDPLQQLHLAVLCGYYYVCLFNTEGEFNDTAKAKSAVMISRWTNTSVSEVLEVIDSQPYYATIRDFVDNAKRSIETSRMEQLNLGLLYVLLGGSWYGSSSSRETVGVALEHPPTFLALINASLQLRSFRSANLAKVVQQATKGGNDKDLLKNLAFQFRDAGLEDDVAEPA